MRACDDERAVICLQTIGLIMATKFILGEGDVAMGLHSFMKKSTLGLYNASLYECE